MNYKKVLEAVKSHVTIAFQPYEHTHFYYHNYQHTEQVMSAVTTMADYYKLKEEERFIVTAAAWFHDIAYLEGAEGHEEKGAQRAEAFLKDQEADVPTINAVKSCILATALPQKPANLLEQILCDADLFHLGTSDFGKRNKLMHKEAEAVSGKAISKRKWLKGTLHFIKDHHYFTEYGRQFLNPNQQKHITKVQSKVGAGLKNYEGVAITHSGEIPEPNRSAHKEIEKKKERSDKSVETMFRISSNNNQRLSYMADTKAHIMISVNSIIITVIISLLLKNMDKYYYLTLPIIVLLTVNLVTILFSMLATRPRLPGGTFTQNDIDEKRVNLLFFGYYYRMDFETYYDGMMKVIDDQSFLYTTLIRDIYQQGIVLSRKYRMLKVAYSVFMYGLIVSVIVFVIAARLH